MTNFATESDVDCTSSAWTFRLTFGISTPIQTDLTFSYSYEGPIDSRDPTLSNIVVSYTINGTFDTAGNGTGRIALNKIAFDLAGVHYECASAPYGWQARLGA